MHQSTMLEAIRSGLENNRQQVLDSLRNLYNIATNGSPQEVRARESAAHFDRVALALNSISSILQHHTPPWVSTLATRISTYRSSQCAPGHAFSIFMDSFTVINNFRFEDTDNLLTNDAAKIVDVNIIDVDVRIEELIGELKEIIDDHGASISSQVAKELAGLVVKLTAAKAQSLFAKKLALFSTVVLLGCLQKTNAILTPETKDAVKNLENKATKTFGEMREAETSALQAGVQTLTVNGAPVNITNININLITQEK